MSYDGPERRGMNQDQINRDRLLTEVHQDVKHIVAWAKQHDEDDDTRFATVSTDISWGKKIIFMGIGALAIIELIVRNM